MQLAYNIIALVLATGILWGIHLMSSPKTAVKGNSLGALCMAAAIVVTLYVDGTLTMPMLWIAMAIGSVMGMVWSIKVKMIQMPQLVALFNGFGGAASALVAMLVFLGCSTNIPGVFEIVTAALAVIVGMITLLGSLVAAGKLHQVLPQKPVHLKGHNAISNLCIAAMVVSLVMTAIVSVEWQLFWSIMCLVTGSLFGVIFTIRVGGADMPVTISLLNSFSGVAGAIAGLSIGDPLLVAVGGIVGASGLFLTQIMCRAMNRSLLEILTGKTSAAGQKPTAKASAKAPEVKEAPKATAPAGNDLATVLATAKKAIIVPGYGMALAQAQHKVKNLADRMTEKGIDVEYAIHPVAGRMPGHMNVLLAEADVPYESLKEMDEVNPQFKDTDVVIIVGANDVVNPAAIVAEGTPIYGMPILRADEAKHIIICNYDLKPGYAGVDNPLYTKDNAIMLLGDAAKTVDQITDVLMNGNAAKAEETASPAGNDLAKILADAKKAIIVPGYGMALAQAQHKVKNLADRLAANGVDVEYAIHPVAGRMPGHMNVLLAEADVPYESLKEMDEVNPQFKDTDVVIIVGANDVVNPAAIVAEGTPIYGMPILRADEAKHIIICNYDTKPGYAGVDNPLYTSDKAIMMLGDAAKTVDEITDIVIKGVCECACPDSAAEAKPQGGDVKAILAAAKTAIIVPGYGMALAQAQHKVKALADKLTAKGVDLEYAIHPVAGRMPGHMNVLLAEADVPYESLKEMDEVNPKFKNTDVVIIVGANDVVNPAAIVAEGTPIYGMPILRADEAKHIIICNYDTKPGYAGVDNPLYISDKATMMLGDAAKTVDELIQMV